MCKYDLNDFYYIKIDGDKVELCFRCYKDYTIYVIDNPKTIQYFLNKHFRPDDELFKILHTKKHQEVDDE